jgi:hypothetical protein
VRWWRVRSAQSGVAPTSLALADSIDVRAAAVLHSSATRAGTCCVSGSSATHQRQADRTPPLLGDLGSGALVGADGKLSDRLATQINQHGPTVIASCRAPRGAIVAHVLPSCRNWPGLENRHSAQKTLTLRRLDQARRACRHPADSATAIYAMPCRPGLPQRWSASPDPASCGSRTAGRIRARCRRTVGTDGHRQRPPHSHVAWKGGAVRRVQAPPDGPSGCRLRARSGVEGCSIRIPATRRSAHVSPPRAR